MTPQPSAAEAASHDSIAVIGAGIIGLATCRALQARGYHVRLYDPNPIGEGTSFGNAGLIANYATSPMASGDTLRQLPGHLLSRQPSLAIALRHTPALADFGWRFLKAATPSNFQRHKADLIALLANAVERQHALIDDLQTKAPTALASQTGCLQIQRDTAITPASLEKMAQAKRHDGVECQALGASELRDLEPSLNSKGLTGGLYYPDTRHLTSPLSLSRQLFAQLEEGGLEWTAQQVDALTPLSSGGWRIDTATTSQEVSHVVICAGIASNTLLAGLGKRLPVVSERGYHIELATSLPLARPVGWLAHHFYASPMAAGIRLAGTTEFCAPSRPASPQRWQALKQWGETLFGQPLDVARHWMGVRHSTPDGLPVVGEMPGCPGLLLAYGHGHLGLTLSAETGDLVARTVAHEPLPEYARSLSPARFCQ
ncbi:FAD-dependent oxidoreductase [Cobetia amphilecti]|uniref:FAD-dependent oxidoreductase n=1 Tax=Cobetia amphilecti TaxID=1055104 RepID=UPI0026E26DEB|nr:FAD-dependent oxidoreductase [Cobetia amphilecti]MDO6814962.1 FAD-dependent oxidoreductase [Cobetia amphilecti]